MTTAAGLNITIWLSNESAQMTPSERLDAKFAALADPTRRAILARLATGEATVMELAEPFDMSQPAISKHLKVLERAGLISMAQDAQRRPRKLDGEAMSEPIDWLERCRQVWAANYARLDDLLEELKAKQAPPKKK
ncbi:MAG TPA: metalloregulator ArsR/SmtB family transcription factor [Polyangiaceae bacterium]